jgi:hypothetical protein
LEALTPASLPHRWKSSLSCDAPEVRATAIEFASMRILQKEQGADEFSETCVEGRFSMSQGAVAGD